MLDLDKFWHSLAVKFIGKKICTTTFKIYILCIYVTHSNVDQLIGDEYLLLLIKNSALGYDHYSLRFR